MPNSRLTSLLDLLRNPTHTFIFKRVKALKMNDRKWDSVGLIICHLRSSICREFSRRLNMNVFVMLGIVMLLCYRQAHTNNLWMIKQDFVKFGKSDAYETQIKDYVDSFSKKVKNHPFPWYALEGLDSPQYLYLIPIGSYNGMDRLVNDLHQYKASYPSTEWDLNLLLRSGTINFFFKTIQQFLPLSSSIPTKYENLFSLSYICLYWIEIQPGKEALFEAHLQSMAQKESSQEIPMCWRVWKETIGAALPQYMIGVFSSTEKEIANHSEKLEFISGPIKQIVRNQTQTNAIIRSDLSHMN